MRIFWLVAILALFSSGCRIGSLRGVSNVCGNDVCEKGEDPGNCPKDCKQAPLPDYHDPEADSEEE